MAKTVKIKLRFTPDIPDVDRNKLLTQWALGTNKGREVNIVEIKHFPEMSYIIVENLVNKNRP